LAAPGKTAPTAGATPCIASKSMEISIPERCKAASMRANCEVRAIMRAYRDLTLVPYGRCARLCHSKGQPSGRSCSRIANGLRGCSDTHFLSAKAAHSLACWRRLVIAPNSQAGASSWRPSCVLPLQAPRQSR
jgi:hypothetical protein